MIVDDRYGEALASTLLAVGRGDRGHLDRALELALKPFSLGLKFDNRDLILLHNIAASVHWKREELHDALVHLVKEHDIASRTGIPDRTSSVSSNMGAILLSLGEFELALAASSQA